MNHPGERIILIRQICEKLERYDWQEVDLILGQYNIPRDTPFDWSGDKKSYIIHAIQDTPTDVLLNLLEFLSNDLDEFPSSDPLTKSVEKCWSSGKLKVFISHSSKEKKKVVEVKKLLMRFGIAAFVAHEDIQISEDWEKEILCGLNTCDTIVAWITENASTSTWTQQEIGMGLAKNKLIIPVRVENSELGFLRKTQGIEGKNDKQVGNIVVEIVHTLIEKPKTKPLLQEAILYSLELSESAKEVDYKIDILKKFDLWDDLTLDILEKSLNFEKVKESSKAYDKIKAILQKYRQSKEAEEIIFDDLPF